MSCAYWAPKSTTRTGRWSVSVTGASLRRARAPGSRGPAPPRASLLTPGPLLGRGPDTAAPVGKGPVGKGPFGKGPVIQRSDPLLVLDRGASREIGLDALVGPALAEERQHRDDAEEHQQQHPRQAPAHLHPQVEAEHHV